MKTQSRLFVLVATSTLTVSWMVSLVHGSYEARASSRHVRGEGDWATDGRRQRSVQTWDLDVKRVGDSLAGTIELSGSALATSGVVQGRVKGERVFGSIQDEAGRLIARFEGERQDGVVRGRYHDRSGETGSWSWAGGWE